MTTAARYQRAEEAGWALKSTAPSQKILANTLGLSATQVSKQINGIRASVATAYHDAIRKLVRSRKCDAGHLIAEALMVAVDEAALLPEGEIRDRLAHAIDAEQEAQTGEDSTTHRVIKALARTASPLATKDDDRELREALEASDRAFQHEGAHHINCLVYNRALRVCRGWRAAS